MFRSCWELFSPRSDACLNTRSLHVLDSVSAHRTQGKSIFLEVCSPCGHTSAPMLDIQRLQTIIKPSKAISLSRCSRQLDQYPSDLLSEDDAVRLVHSLSTPPCYNGGITSVGAFIVRWVDRLIFFFVER